MIRARIVAEKARTMARMTAEDSIKDSASLSVTANGTATLTVVASGTSPFSYQWYASGAAISSATSSSYSAPTNALGDISYTVAVTNAAGSVTSSAAVVTVTAIQPTLQFTSIATQTFGEAAFTVSASSASSGAITYSVTSGPATVSGSTVTLTGAGAVVLHATQAASGLYAAATGTTSFSVNKATPTVSTWPTASSITYGQTLASSTLSGGVGSVSGSFAWTTSSTVPSAGTSSQSVTFTPTDTTDYNTVTSTVSVTTSKATPTINSWPTASSITYGQTLASSTLSGGSGSVSGSFAWTTSSTAPSIGTSSQSVTFTPTDTTDYNTATGTVSVTVNQATPTINSSPSATSLEYGQALSNSTLSGGSASANGSSVAGSFAWTNSSTIPTAGTTQQSITFTPSDTTDYTTATGTASVTMSNVTLTAISGTEAGGTAEPGTYTFSTTATGGVTNNVNWSASSGSITSAGVWTSPTTPGSYTITATSAEETSVSASTTVTISKPVITSQPVSKSVCSGSGTSTTLQVGASYADSYQWSVPSTATNYSGTTTTTLSLKSLASGDTGKYYCTATNEAGSTTTNTVTLNVTSGSAPTISSPSSVSVWATQTATFAVSASGGVGTMSYQWYKNTTNSTSGGTAISGATNSVYTTGALSVSDSGTYYYATVTDIDCTNTTQTTSSAAEVTVSDAVTDVPPSIVTQPTGQTATSSGSATFTVVASGPGTLTYQWYEVTYSSTMSSDPGSTISSATSASYTESNPSGKDGYEYYVVVKNEYGQATSNRVTLAVGAGIQVQISDQPQTEYISADSLAAFSVTATCTDCTPAYQWYWIPPASTTAVALTDSSSSTQTDLTGADISGSTTSSVTINNTPTAASGGDLYVVVTSTDGDGNQISGTEPLTSSKAALFVGSLGTVGNTTSGDGLCNSTTSWQLNGTNPGTASGNVPYQDTSGCKVRWSIATITNRPRSSGRR